MEPRAPSEPTASVPKAWPFEEAQKLATRLAAAPRPHVALFETGYGPSGLPHIGTFGEVARTSWVRLAFTDLTGLPSRLVAFSDDMDGLRKVPDNVPDRERLAEFLGRPLTDVPDPFGTHQSFGAHNNARLRAFLDSFGFEYEFVSATETYRAGRFDAALRLVLARHAQILAVVLPTLGPDRRATYSAILPLHPRSGRVMQVPITPTGPETIAWTDPESGERFETAITRGGAKLQWKADWAMRWAALGVDYEMSGKDLIDSVKLSGAICRILGANPPAGFTYELFLDEHAQKISKSKGNGLAVEEWLRYAPPESLAQFMFNAPQRAKRLYFDVIPRAVDDYLANDGKLAGQQGGEAMANPAWHIHAGEPSGHGGSPVSFTMLQNLAAVVGADDPGLLWGFIRRYAPEASPAANPFLDGLVRHAIAYWRERVLPTRQTRAPTEQERAALADLAGELDALPADTGAEELQNLVFAVGKRHEFAELRAWFGSLYEILFGQAEGPRFGGFIALYGVAETARLIRDALARNSDAG